VDGYRRSGAYIATQGPLPETFADFWRMVWEQRTSAIVMMTRLEERNRVSVLHALVLMGRVYGSCLSACPSVRLSVPCGLLIRQQNVIEVSQ